jgi:SAM-dependent methyltransferase
MASDAFSEAWYQTFLEPIDPAVTDREAEFVAQFAPPDVFPTLLDIACGPGRHAAALTSKGYQLTGIDKDEPSIASAIAKRIPNAEFSVCDMREIANLETTFDVAVNLWHSFGYYDDAQNKSIGAGLLERLRFGGRAIFDIYNRQHFQSWPREIVGERDGEKIRTVRTWRSNRMRCEIIYEVGAPDILEWYIFEPEEFADWARSIGFSVVIVCAQFDENQKADAEHGRMQFVLEKPE